MVTRRLERLLGGGAFFECPRWYEGSWWVSDFLRQTVSKVDEAGNESIVLTLDDEPGGLGWLPDGSLLVVSRNKCELLRVDAGGAISTVASLGDLCGGPMNDMVVDAVGRAYIGDVGFPVSQRSVIEPTTLKLVEPSGSVSVVADGLICPNGAVISPDGRTLIVGESYACRYTAFTVAEDGTLHDRRVWAQLAPAPPLGKMGDVHAAAGCVPDGCGLDAEGHIWSADGVGGRCIRIAPGGRVVDEVVVPEDLNVYACMLGGALGTTLMMCAGASFGRKALESLDAVLLTTTVAVPRAGRP